MNDRPITRRKAPIVVQACIMGLVLVYLIVQSWSNPAHRAFWVAMLLTALTMGGAIGFATYAKSSFAKKLARYLHSRHGASVHAFVLIAFATSRLWSHALGDGLVSGVLTCIVSLVLVFLSFTFFMGALAENTVGQREAG